MSHENQGLGEQALNKVAEMGLKSQLDEVESLDVDIQTDPFKLMQGHVDSVTIEGEGMVMQGDLRVEEMEMHMSDVAINPLSAAFGKLELTKPTQGSARVVLTEADINRAFNSEYVHNQLQNQQIQINGQPTTINPQQVDFRLPGEGKVALSATVMLGNETKQVSFTAVPRVSANGKTVSLEDVHYGEAEEVSPELTKALVDQTSEILNLSNFDMDGITLTINTLQVEAGRLTLQAEAYVEQIPSG